jgi:integrase/recombinase XerD
VRFSALVAEFSAYELPTLAEGTRISYGNSFKAFAAYFETKLGDPLVRDIRRSHVATFLEWRRVFRVGDKSGTAGVSLHTVARDRRVLHRLFNYGIMKDHLDANPCQMVRAPKADPRMPPRVSDEQLEAFLKAAESRPMLHAFIALLADTGARAYSEALALRWEDIDLAGGFLYLRSEPGQRTKSGKARAVPLTPRLKSVLQEHAARFRMAAYHGARSPFVFHHPMTTRSAIAGARVTSFRGAFDAAAKVAKLPAGFRPHDLRHRRVTTWLAAGANPVHVKEAMGHASLATTMGYTHLLPEHLRALVEEQGGAPLRQNGATA